jgi:hypothetical protein
MTSRAAKESPEGFRAWSPWVRRLIVVGALALVALVIGFIISLPAPHREIDIVGYPPTDFITFVEAIPGRGTLLSPISNDIASAERICIGVEQGLLWLAGNEADVLNIQLRRTTQITINNQSVPAQDIFFYNDPLAFTQRVDDAGQPAGSHGGEMSICVRTGFLPVGDFIAVLTLANTAGTTFTFDWAFSIR